MKLLYHQESELSRNLLASLPVCVEVIEGDGGYHVSAYPSVVVMVPAYIEKRPAFNEAGEFIGMVDFSVPEHEEILRMPSSWDAVREYLDFVQARAVDLTPT